MGTSLVGMLSWLLVGLCWLLALIMALATRKHPARAMFWWLLGVVCAAGMWILLLTGAGHLG